MCAFKSHFQFNKQERSGIFFLLLSIVLIQITYYFFSSYISKPLDHQIVLDNYTQAQIDALKHKVLQKDTLAIYPFNPNFMTDNKGYRLGMSVEEIDRLLQFRATNTYVNSAKEFQEVTLISDSLLRVIAPYFKFPDWVEAVAKRAKKNNLAKLEKRSEASAVKDLNTVTADELREIKGIGETLSARIIKFRKRLGGFLIEEQLYDVYGLDEDVVQRALKKYRVLTKPEISKININTATVEDIAKIVYLQKPMARRIVAYRNAHKNILSFDELLEIEEFPVDKIDRIKLYLSL